MCTYTYTVYHTYHNQFTIYLSLLPIRHLSMPLTINNTCMHALTNSPFIDASYQFIIYLCLLPIHHLSMPLTIDNTCMLALTNSPSIDASYQFIMDHSTSIYAYYRFSLCVLPIHHLYMPSYQFTTYLYLLPIH